MVVLLLFGNIILAIGVCGVNLEGVNKLMCERINVTLRLSLLVLDPNVHLLVELLQHILSLDL
jgi:hypothetical protein